jgi:rhodanese-related sulfurtransferase
VSPEVPEVSVDELADAITSGTGRLVLVDVREPYEYAEAHVPGAVLIPLATVPDELARFPPGPPVYVICASGGRSYHAADWLRSQGINAVNVAGGTKGWIASGRTTMAGESPS